MYGLAKAAAIIEEGAKDGPGPAAPRRKRDNKTPGGVVLPTGVDP